jgi:hypothetical protein
MKTGKVIGNFDCRVWKKDTPKQARQMVAQGERINLSVAFDEADLTDELKEFTRFHEKSGKWYANIKVFPKSCKIFTASAKQIDFPDYKKIDGGRFEVIVEFVIKHGKEKTTELNGLYANAIQIIKRADVPFEPIAGVSDDFLAGNAPDPFGGEDDDEKTNLPF